MKGLFWVSMAFVMYTYVGYPLALWLLGKRRSRDVVGSEIVPTVSIIIAARNEADKIQRKLDHTLALKYPTERLEIIVASDASDDGTDEIVKAYAARGVRLVRAPQRNGKEYVQGLAVAGATGDVIVFTDSATILEPEALRSLVQNFADPTIGAVSTEDCLVDAAGNPTGEGLYVKYEMWVRRLESRFHSIVGLSGSCFAMRRELCTPLAVESRQRFPIGAADGAGRLPLGRGRVRAGPVRRGRLDEGGDAPQDPHIPAGHHRPHGARRPAESAPPWPVRVPAGQPQAAQVSRADPSVDGPDRQRGGRADR